MIIKTVVCPAYPAGGEIHVAEIAKATNDRRGDGRGE